MSIYMVHPLCGYNVYTSKEAALKAGNRQGGKFEVIELFPVDEACVDWMIETDKLKE